MAPPRKPTQLLLLQGTANVTRMREQGRDLEPRPAKDKVRAPQALSKDARRIWRRVAPELQACGILTNIDVMALQMLCTQWQLWESSMEKCQRLGMVVLDANGVPHKNPYFDIANRAADKVVQLLREFGMTPAARSRIQVDRSQAMLNLQGVDPWAQFGPH